ncbi:MAG: hypothetical protein J5509_12095, partial [Lachnospiraceae bacterium]|nr:hypothetical protein [Lachnospiraceae bacterium]
MKKKNAKHLILSLMVASVMLAGCGNTQDTAAVTQTNEASETNEAAETLTGFSKGVYVNYAKEAVDPPKTYFYVFSEDNYGYVADGENNDMGYPFDIVQADGKVTFTVGGEGAEEEVFVITGNEDGKIYGYFEDIPERELVFEPVPDADPKGFSAVNYLNAAAGEHLVYTDANGWSVTYNPNTITVNAGGPVTTFVYTGECAGS